MHDVSCCGSENDHRIASTECLSFGQRSFEQRLKLPAVSEPQPFFACLRLKTKPYKYTSAESSSEAAVLSEMGGFLGHLEREPSAQSFRARAGSGDALPAMVAPWILCSVALCSLPGAWRPKPRMTGSRGSSASTRTPSTEVLIHDLPVGPAKWR